MTKTKYTGENIKILKGLEGIRMRYDMYVGSRDTAAFHLVKEALDNCVDEYINGHATQISVDLDTKTNIIKILDNGRGLPIDIHPTENKPTMEVLFTNLHSGGKFDKDSFKVSSGKNGIGIKAINALSDMLKITSIRDYNTYSMEFSKGIKVSDMTKGKSKINLEHGTLIEFRPDKEILGEYSILDVEQIRENLEIRTYSNAGLKISFKYDGKEEVFYHENGIRDYLDKLSKKPICDNLYFDYKDNEGNFYEVAMNYDNTTEETFKSFVNGINTSKGTHETGFKMALSSVFIDYIKKNNILPKKFENMEIKGDDVRQGINCIINIRHIAAEYKGQTKDELSNPEILGVMRKITNTKLGEFLSSNQEMAKKLSNRIIAFAKGRLEANKIKDKIININSSSAGLSFSAKFNDCESNNPEECEIFITEGKSASGNINLSRIPETQAVYPLQGKILNTYGSKKSTILDNKELQELIKVIFGTTDMENIDYDKVRYHKIIILADADIDGSHIQSLLLLFFHEHFKELIERGYIYLAIAPKYRTNINGKYVYFRNDKELNDEIYKYTSKKYKTNNIDLHKILDNANKFIELYERIKLKYSISNDVINSFIEDGEQVYDILELDFKLKVEGDKVYGIHDNIWHDFILSDEFFDDLEKLYSIYNEDIIIIEDLKNNEVLEYSLIDGVKMLKSTFNYTLDYFKGLGEASADELFETTLDPKKRELIQVKLIDVEGTDIIMKDLFGDNTSARKLFVNKNLSM